MKKSCFSKHTLIFCFIFSSSLYSSIAASSDDSYLNALDAEAEDSASTQNINTKTSTITTQDSKKDLLAIQRKIEFTTLLSNELPATARTYYKLTKTQQQQVIDSYFDSNKSMSKATHLLFNLYFKNNTATNKKGS